VGAENCKFLRDSRGRTKETPRLCIFPIIMWKSIYLPKKVAFPRILINRILPFLSSILNVSIPSLFPEKSFSTATLTWWFYLWLLYKALRYKFWISLDLSCSRTFKEFIQHTKWNWISERAGSQNTFIYQAFLKEFRTSSNLIQTIQRHFSLNLRRMRKTNNSIFSKQQDVLIMKP